MRLRLLTASIMVSVLFCFPVRGDDDIGDADMILDDDFDDFDDFSTRPKSTESIEETGRIMYEDFLARRYGTDDKPLPPDILRKNCLDDLDNYVSRWIMSPTRLDLMELVTQRLVSVADESSLPQMTEIINRLHLLERAVRRDMEGKSVSSSTRQIPNGFGLIINRSLSEKWFCIAEQTLSQKELDMIIMSSLDNSGKGVNFSVALFYQPYEASPGLASFFRRHRDEIVKMLMEGNIREDFLEENIRHVESIFFSEEVAITEKEALAIYEKTPLPRIKRDILRLIQYDFPDNRMGQEMAIKTMLAENRDENHIKTLVYFLNSDKLDDERKEYIFKTLHEYLLGHEAKATGEAADMYITAYAIFWLTSAPGMRPRDFVKSKYNTIKEHLDWFEIKFNDLNDKGKVDSKLNDLYSNWLDKAKQEMSSWPKGN